MGESPAREIDDGQVTARPEPLRQGPFTLFQAMTT
jgi:hypothetical protein